MRPVKDSFETCSGVKLDLAWIFNSISAFAGTTAFTYPDMHALMDNFNFLDRHCFFVYYLRCY